jgi:hypothetical protein
MGATAQAAVGRAGGAASANVFDDVPLLTDVVADLEAISVLGASEDAAEPSRWPDVAPRAANPDRWTAAVPADAPLRLAGVIPTVDQQELGHVQEILTSRFAWARLDSSGLRPSPGDDAWVANLPAGVLRDAAARLRALADPVFGGSRPEGASPEVASRGLLELYAILGGETR